VSSLYKIAVFMPCLVIGLGVAPGEFGPAPKGTLDPVRNINHLRDIFRNCEFSARQTRRSVQPAGAAFTRVSNLECKVCADVSVVQSKDHMKDQVDYDGNPMQDRISYTERRWVRDKPGYDLEVTVRDGVSWPTGEPTEDGVGIAWLTVIADDRYRIWDKTPIGDLLGEVDLVSGLTLADMVTDGGRRGYVLKSVTWASADHSSITYEFKSADFGISAVTFSKVAGEWKPSEIQIERSADDKVFADAKPGELDRVKNFNTFSDFDPPAPGLDQFDSIFKITYGADGRLPVAIERADYYYYKGERADLVTKLVFSSLRTRDISCDEVREAMLPIPDGVEVHLPFKEGSERLAWTIRNGEVVNAYSDRALAMGRETTFFTGRRVGLLTTWAAFAVLLAILLYRYRGRFLAKGVD
jgi:hypothetical protein